MKKDELDEEIKRLKEPIDDFRLMIEAAMDACARRRKLVYRFYEAQEFQQAKVKDQYSGGVYTDD